MALEGEEQIMADRLQEYADVYRMLEDDESKDIYLNRLNYLISGNLSYIKKIVTAYLPNLTPLKGKTIADLRDSMPKDRKIVLYGAGVIGKECLRYWACDDRFVGFCSGTKSKQKTGYLGCPVMSPEELLAQNELNVVINTTRARDEIAQILEKGGYPRDQIFDIADYYPQGDGSDPGQYFEPEFMRYEDEEVFVDAGCFDLECSIRLSRYCGHVKKVYAFEPDPENYRRCLARKETENFSQAEILPVGTWSERTVLHFKEDGDVSSCIAETGGSSVCVAPIDEVVDPDERVTFIKMDVEGAELESLKGAKRTILRDKPKLAVCIYHKTEDMVTIPRYIKQLVPEYRLYVRHHSNGNTETVLYAVMP